MSTPPRVDPVEVERALSRIADRRRQIGDEQFGSIDCDDPIEVRRYLRKRHAWTMRHGSHVAFQDITDGLVLLVWQWWEERREELWWLSTGHQLGHTYAELGSPLGIGSRIRGHLNVDGEPTGNRRQGTKSRIDRLRALLKYDRPDESLIRDERRADRELAERADPEQGWVTDHVEVIAEIARRLCALGELANDEAASDLVEVQRYVDEENWTPRALVWMGLAVQSLRVSENVLGLSDRHPARRVFEAVERLRSAFAELAPAGSEAGSARRR